jgi:hypothetical protein
MNTNGADGGTVVHVIFRNAQQEEQGFYMEPSAYAAIPLSTVATPEDYQAHGHLLPAPTAFR